MSGIGKQFSYPIGERESLKQFSGAFLVFLSSIGFRNSGNASKIICKAFATKLTFFLEKSFITLSGGFSI